MKGPGKTPAPRPRRQFLWGVLTLASALAALYLLLRFVRNGFPDGYRSPFERFWHPLHLVSGGLGLLLTLWSGMQLFRSSSSRPGAANALRLWLALAGLLLLLWSLPTLLQGLLGLDTGSGG